MTSKCILILDDSSQSLTELTTALEAAHYKTHRVDQPDAFMKTFARLYPDLVIIHTGSISGADTLQLMHLDPVGTTTPSILMGDSSADINTVAQAHDIGADLYLPMPLDIASTLDHVRGFVGIGKTDTSELSAETANAVSQPYTDPGNPLEDKIDEQLTAALEAALLPEENTSESSKDEPAIPSTAPTLRPPTEPAPNTVPPTADTNQAPAQQRSSGRTILAASLVFAISASAGWMAYRALTQSPLSGPSIRATVTPEAISIPDYHEEVVTGLEMVGDQWLGFTDSGRIEAIKLHRGDTVQQGDVIAHLQIPKALNVRLNKTRKQLNYASKKHLQSTERLAELLAADNRLNQELKENYEGLGAIVPDQQAQEQRNTLLAEQKTIKRKLAWVTRKLAQTKKREIKTQSWLTKLQQKRNDLELQVSSRLLLAPFDGVIAESNLRKGKQAAADKPMVRVQNMDLYEMGLSASRLPKLRAGDSIYVGTEAEDSLKATVVEATRNRKRVRLVVRVPDKKKTILRKKPKAIKVATELQTNTYKIPAEAVQETKEGVSAIEILNDQGNAITIAVEIIANDKDRLIVSSEDSRLNDVARVLVAD